MKKKTNQIKTALTTRLKITFDQLEETKELEATLDGVQLGKRYSQLSDLHSKALLVYHDEESDFVSITAALDRVTKMCNEIELGF